MKGPAKRKTRLIHSIFVLLLAGGSTVCAADLGRLFSTPQERAALDQLRSPRPILAPPAPADEAQERARSGTEELAAAVPPVTVNGIVRRLNGNSTVWINGINSFNGNLDSQRLRVRRPRTDAVPVEVNDEIRVMLRVGETLDPDRYQIRDVYQAESAAEAAAAE